MRRLIVLAAAVAACNPLAKKEADPVEAGAPPASAAPAASPLSPRKALDATSCNPGTSLDPVDKGKSIESDHFRYTLLDVRSDSVAVPGGATRKVFLVKLEVENITSKPDLNTSVSEVDLSRDKAGADRVKDRGLVYKTEFFYPRAKMCVDLGSDVGKGKIPPGAKVVGYYAFDAGDAPYDSLWFSARNVAPESVKTGGFLKVAGSLRVK